MALEQQKILCLLFSEGDAKTTSGKEGKAFWRAFQQQQRQRKYLKAFYNPWKNSEEKPDVSSPITTQKRVLHAFWPEEHGTSSRAFSEDNGTLTAMASLTPNTGRNNLHYLTIVTELLLKITTVVIKRQTGGSGVLRRSLCLGGLPKRSRTARRTEIGR